MVRSGFVGYGLCSRSSHRDAPSIENMAPVKSALFESLKELPIQRFPRMKGRAPQALLLVEICLFVAGSVFPMAP